MEPSIGRPAVPNELTLVNSCTPVGFTMDVKDVGQVMPTGFVIYLISKTDPLDVNKPNTNRLPFQAQHCE